MIRIIDEIFVLTVFVALDAGVMRFIQPKPLAYGIFAIAETSGWPSVTVTLASIIIPPRDKDSHWDFIRECSNPTLDLTDLFIHGLDSQGRPVVRAPRKVESTPTSSHQFNANIPAEPQGEMKDHYEVSLTYYHPEEWNAVHSISALYTLTCDGQLSSSYRTVVQ